MLMLLERRYYARSIQPDWDVVYAEADGSRAFDSFDAHTLVDSNCAARTDAQRAELFDNLNQIAFDVAKPTDGRIVLGERTDKDPAGNKAAEPAPDTRKAALTSNSGAAPEKMGQMVETSSLICQAEGCGLPLKWFEK